MRNIYMVTIQDPTDGSKHEYACHGVIMDTKTIQLMLVDSTLKTIPVSGCVMQVEVSV